jgi:uncharacterized protein (TIGR02145 family)
MRKNKIIATNYACPKGWHLPNEKEWCPLADCGDGQYYSGKKLKAKSGWDKYEDRDGNGTDIYGFSALPGGSAYFQKDRFSGDFNYSALGTIGYWWIATENDNDYSTLMLGSGGDETVAEKPHYSLSYSLSYFYSVRCIKGSGEYSDNSEHKILSFKDNRDGKTYKYVDIGSQTWMAENLNYETPESKCYNDTASYCDQYGRLYNWNEAMGVCPSGWHLPSDKEFRTLNDYVGEYGGKIAEKLKATDADGTDDYGFAALTIVYWSNDEVNIDNAYGQYIWDEFITSLIGGNDKRSLYSVRCVRG